MKNIADTPVNSRRVEAVVLEALKQLEERAAATVHRFDARRGTKLNRLPQRVTA